MTNTTKASLASALNGAGFGMTLCQLLLLLILGHPTKVTWIFLLLAGLCIVTAFVIAPDRNTRRP